RSIRVFNTNRRLLRELYDIKRDAPWLVSAEDAYALVAVGGLVTALLAVLAPEFFRVIVGGFEWVTGIGYAGGGRTIAEARATDLDDLYREYGPLFYGAIAGLLLVAGSVVRDPRPANVTLLVWSAFMLVAAFAQIRFNYYFAVNVVLLNGFVLASVAKLVRWDEAWHNLADPPPVTKGRKAAPVTRLTWKQPVAVGAVALLVLPGNVFLYDGADTCGGGAPYRPAWYVAQCMGADRDIQYWTDGLHWMRDHTPDPGFDVAALPDKDSFQYPAGAYGVISWWDYGHWEEVLAERPPVANPFQQAAPFASRYFTSQDEAAAEAMLDEWSPEFPVRYVLIDDASATTKFYAITVWAGFTEYGDQSAERRLPDGRDVRLPVVGEPYSRTMMSRLYRDDGADLDHYRLVHEERMTSLIGNIVDAQNGRIVSFQDILQWGSPETMERDYTSLNYRSREFVCEGPIDAADVCTSGRYAYDLEVHSALKIFERVRGARLVGTGEPGERVEAILELRATNTGRVFDVTKETTVGPDGRWSVLVAYPTTGFLGVDAGGTDSDVVPKGEWLVGLGGTFERARVVVAAHVTEADVLEGRTVEAR
ncbi:MAG TPA: hypothetical protein VI997_06890, partial [Candidatus Thermoplasmatota archaeon]|nr:hypothetical protein [Candidatus Thermoplasmatota archaeon]